MPWPFSYLPWPLNFLALWAGWCFILVTFYCAVKAILRWWVYHHYRDEIDEWAEMRRQAQEVRDNIRNN